jgi:hypothetical protein
MFFTGCKCGIYRCSNCAVPMTCPLLAMCWPCLLLIEWGNRKKRFACACVLLFTPVPAVRRLVKLVTLANMHAVWACVRARCCMALCLGLNVFDEQRELYADTCGRALVQRASVTEIFV